MAGETPRCNYHLSASKEISIQQLKKESSPSLFLQQECDLVIGAIVANQELVMQECSDCPMAKGETTGIIDGFECRSEFFEGQPFDDGPLKKLVASARDPEQVIWPDNATPRH